MALHLSCESGTEIEDPSGEDVARVLRSLAASGNYYAILAEEEMTYLQTAVDERGLFVLEYQAGSLDEHYKCPDLSYGEVERVFLAYREGASWRDTVRWQKLDLTLPA